jgi:hypothetical protein
MGRVVFRGNGWRDPVVFVEAVEAFNWIKL